MKRGPLIFGLSALLGVACGGATPEAPLDGAVPPNDAAGRPAVAQPPRTPEPTRDAVTPPSIDAGVSGTDVARADVVARDSGADAAVGDTGAAMRDAADGARGDGPAAALCAPGSTLLVCDPLRALPRTIKETGLFPSAPDFRTAAATMRRFLPNWELWSDGLDKDRFIILPRTQTGQAQTRETIDISNREAWVFPIGTILVKTFFADNGPSGVRRPVETRIIRRVNDPDPFEQYKFDVYRWNATGTDADLLDLTNPTLVDITIGGKALRHKIPSRTECGKCHSENDTPVIGFDEVRLNWTLPSAPATQLATFAADGVFKTAPPVPAQTVTDPSPLVGRIKGFVFGNCVHCHSGRNPQLVDLRPSVFVQNTVGKMTMGSGTAVGLRVDPGRPESSILWLQVAHMRPRLDVNPMPPVGVQIPNTEAVSSIGDWIRSLPRP